MSRSGESTSSRATSSEVIQREQSDGPSACTSPPASDLGGSLASEASLFGTDQAAGQHTKPPILVDRTAGKRKPSASRRRGRRITWNLTPDFAPTATESSRYRRFFPGIACLAVSVAVGTCFLVLGSFSLLDTYRDSYFPTTLDSEYKITVRSIGLRRGPAAAVPNATPAKYVSPTSPAWKARRAARLHPQKYHQEQSFCILNVSSWSLGPAKRTKESVLTDLEEYCVVFVYCDNAGSSGRRRPARFQAGQVVGRRLDRTVSMLVGLRVGEAAFRKVLSHGTPRARFVRNILRFMENNGYDGIRLWWSGATTCNVNDLVGAARAIGDALGKRNYSFGFFLPYDLLPSGVYLARLARLRKALRGAPYGLLLYPTFPVFRNQTSWPSPADIAIPWRVAKNDLSLCHVLPQQPVWVALHEMCDASRTQRISGLASPTAAALFEPCRLLREESWQKTTLRFYSYACKEDKGVLYQTAAQADTFRHEFLAETKVPCVGSIGETIGCEAEDSAVTSL